MRYILKKKRKDKRDNFYRKYALMGYLSVKMDHHIFNNCSLVAKIQSLRGFYMVKGQSINLLKTCSSSYVAAKVKIRWPILTDKWPIIMYNTVPSVAVFFLENCVKPP